MKNIPVGQLICLKRNCSDPQKFEQVEQEALTCLEARRYPKLTLNRASNLEDKIPRENLLMQNKNENKKQIKNKNTKVEHKQEDEIKQIFHAIQSAIQKDY